MRRNLIYYLLPVSGNGVWQRNVKELKRRADLFTGLRKVAVAQQEGKLTNNHVPRPERSLGLTTDPWEQVAEMLPGFDVYPVPHNPHLGECSVFPALLTETLKEDGYTFFAHGKGVTWPVDALPCVNPWAPIMYSINLDFWPLVEGAFKKGYTMYGAFKQILKPYVTKRVAVRERGTLVYKKIMTEGVWEYSGTFFWFNNAAVRNTPNHFPDGNWIGVERWPGKVFKHEQGACDFGAYHNSLLYNGIEKFRDKFIDWSNQHADVRRPDASATPWVEFSE